MPDANLPPPIDLAGLVDGDAAAQRAVWVGYWERVERICAGVLGRGAEASEVATDVVHDFIFEYAQNLSSDKAAWSYMKLMAARRSLRRRRRRGRHDDVEDVPLVDDDAPRTMLEAAHAAVIRERLDGCLEHLTPKAQQVLKLRFGADMTTPAIGELVGGSKQYIGRLIKESTAKLRRCLEAPRGADAAPR